MIRATLAAIIAATVLTATPADAATFYNFGRVAGHPGCSSTMPRTGLASLQCLDGFRRKLTPCPTEDSGNRCYWNARVRGNGIGRRFVVIGHHVYYPVRSVTR